MENQTQAASLGLGTAELPELLTLQQASKILKVHPNTLRNWERAGVIPVVRVGPRRDRRFPKHGIHQFLPGAQPATNLAGAPIESAPAESSLEQSANPPIDQATAVTPDGVEVPISVAESELAPEQVLDEPAVEEATQETPHVIVNVPPKQSSIILRVVIGIVLITLAVAATALLFRQLSSQAPAEQDSGFAIRRNPPSVLFSDDFEAYEVGQPPRTVWSSVGVWRIDGNRGEKYLHGEAAVENPLDLMSHTYTGASDWKDYQFKFDARYVSGEKTLTALVDYLDEDNYYSVQFSETAVVATLVVNGKETKLGEHMHTPDHSHLSAFDGSWHTFSINLFGDMIDVYLEGERVMGIDNSSLTTGKVGLAIRNQIMDFDHVQVVQQTE